ncbi:LysM peptidoglycan-binding domain-containing protein [Labilibaculum sp. DW002]|uniref:LysM peptidoglycan-binding domain-containing protein n=1 Tax=Paralabilibaculum antarcticum TaxID=2912572 RepID=A0ABT5VWG7_9BACT|nr:LysM peptidoglycan-binding domain-containing protein [Labilibaculum sp. DW002]MDE5419764.1 LysM peptidoglycan-binding domain-containing protein [Labilibaculum sp. DW002]
MNYFFRSILLICLLFETLNFAHAQSTTIELSNNKVVVGGQTCFLHLVKEKQTLFSISRAYGVELSVILQVNHKTEVTVNVGEVLRIPVVDSKTAVAPMLVKKEDDQFIYHVIKKNDTFFSLSKKYDLSIDVLKKSNPNIGDVLSLGSVFMVPKGIKKEKKVIVQTHPKHDKKYYYHVIQKGDTESAIARKFFMKLRKFRKLNPQLKGKALTIGSWVRIPRYLVPPEYFVEKPVEKDTIVQEIEEDKLIVNEVVERPLSQQKIRIALFLPLYLEANDTINEIVTYKDTLRIVNERNTRTVFPKSHNFIRFYQGILLAVDSLQKEGLSVDLHVFDTERKPERVQRILSGIQYTDLDFIIGPVYSNTFSLVASFAQKRGIPIISPLSPKNSLLKTNPFVIQLNTSIESICGRISDYVGSDLEMKNLIVVHPDRYQHLSEYQLVKDIERQLFEKGEYWKNDEMSYRKISFEEYGLFGIERILSDTCENVILLPSTKQPYVENIISNLNVLSQRFAIRLMGFPVWKRYNSLESELFYNLNLSILTPYHIDYKEEKIENFVSSFRTKFKCEPNDFSFRGFDLCRYFTKAVSQYGNHFPDHLSELQIDLLQSHFDFKRVNAFGGLENQGVHFVNYSRDFKIRHHVPNFESK